MVNFIILFLTLDPYPSVIQGSRVNINDLMKVMKEKGSAKNAKKIPEMLWNIQFPLYYSSILNSPNHCTNKIKYFNTLLENSILVSLFHVEGAQKFHNKLNYKVWVGTNLITLVKGQHITLKLEKVSTETVVLKKYRVLLGSFIYTPIFWQNTLFYSFLELTITEIINFYIKYLSLFMHL